MELTTRRLRLRELHETDFSAIREFEGDAYCQRFEGPPYTEEQTYSKLIGAIEWAQEQPRSHFKLGITIPPDDVVRGRISLTLNNPSTREWEIGWTIHRLFWGKGYAPEAARTALAYLFENLHAHRVIAFTNRNNQPSVRVMEKLGMRQDGCLREALWLNGAWNDELIYSILDREFSELIDKEIIPCKK